MVTLRIKWMSPSFSVTKNVLHHTWIVIKIEKRWKSTRAIGSVNTFSFHYEILCSPPRRFAMGLETYKSYKRITHIDFDGDVAEPGVIPARDGLERWRRDVFGFDVRHSPQHPDCTVTRPRSIQFPAQNCLKFSPKNAAQFYPNIRHKN